MPRIALGLEYDGTDFVGWQIQRSGRSVEAALAAAVQAVAAEPLTVRGAGRTDAGVHAAQQVAHFDTGARRSERQWLLGINSNLPPDVAVRWVREVPATFDARRSALRRRYRYSVLQQPTRPALARARVWWIREPLDAAGDDGRVAALARRARLLGVSRGRLSGEIADAPAARRADCARRACGRRSRGRSISRPMLFYNTWCATSSARSSRSGAATCRPAAAGVMLGEPRPHAGRGGGAARGAHVGRGVVSGALPAATVRADAECRPVVSAIFRGPTVGA